MVSDHELADALGSLLRESNPNTFTSINGVVQQLESKLGLDLSTKFDFIRNQIHLLFRSQPQQQPSPPKDQFPLSQNPNFQNTHNSHIAPNYTTHRPVEDLNFRCAPPQQQPVSAPKAESYIENVAAPSSQPPKERFDFTFNSIIICSSNFCLAL